MNCEGAMELIYAGVDGPVSAGDEEKLSEHLRGCDRCRAEFGNLNRLEEVLRSVPEPPVSRTRLGETVKAVSLELRAGGRANAAHHRVGVWAVVAAAVVIAAEVGLLAGRRLALPGGETRESREEPVARGTGFSPAHKGGAAEVPVSQEDITPRRGDLLVERLVQADLALSDAEGPGHKAVIFCTMSRDVLSELQDSVGRSDTEAVRTLGQGYTRLVRDGILPNVTLASGDEDRERVSQVAHLLKGSREVLELLVGRTKGHERTLLAEALSISEQCLSATEGEPGFF